MGCQGACQPACQVLAGGGRLLDPLRPQEKASFRTRPGSACQRAISSGSTRTSARDSLLAVSGELDDRPGGPSDIEEKKSLRRSLYLLQKREQPPAVQHLFDGPSAATESCPKRHVSTVPLQALYLLNNEFVLKRAEALARRVLARAGAGRGRQIEEAFLLTLGRRPEAAERAAARRFFTAYDRSGEEGARTALVHFCHSLLSLNEFIYLE